jgi:hypothetical protein
MSQEGSKRVRSLKGGWNGEERRAAVTKQHTNTALKDQHPQTLGKKGECGKGDKAVKVSEMSVRLYGGEFLRVKEGTWICGT